MTAADRDSLRAQLRVRIEDYLRQKGLPLTKPFRCLCPDHEDKHPSMSYHRKAHSVHCFSCGATYDLFDLIGLDYNITAFSDQLMAASRLFLAQEEDHAPKTGRVTPLPRIAAQTPLAVPSVYEPPAYLLGRGLARATCERAGAFVREGRVWFPFVQEGRTVGFCGRGIDDALTPRYKNSAGTLPLWNGDTLRSLLQSGGAASVYVTEGIVDALCLIELGASAVALCGSQNTNKLLDCVDKAAAQGRALRFVLCGDPDDAGQRMNRTLEEALALHGFPCEVLPLTKRDGDVAALFAADKPRLLRLLAASGTAAPQEDYAASSAAGALDTFFLERERRAGRTGVSTGFAALDDVLDGGLHPGLHILGAISSVGKTSFVLQMADWIAEHEQDVLFFSLEQSRFELMAKSLSRMSARLLPEHAFTVRALLSGAPVGTLEADRLLREVRQHYQQAAAGLFLREGLADIGPDEIRAEIQRHIESRGKAPVVFVDYLQILKPWEPRATDKQNIDHAVVALKRLSRDFEIPVVAVSSFNRDNYRTAVSMEAFKESGAVEYSADVLLGLQLKGAGEREFDVNKAKLENPRQIELVMLKNRNGIPFAKLPFLYDAKFGAFTQAARVMQLGIRS